MPLTQQQIEQFLVTTGLAAWQGKRILELANGEATVAAQFVASDLKVPDPLTKYDWGGLDRDQLVELLYRRVAALENRVKALGG